ncbi:LytTR family transcriptional regulator DNA-binding domain-containing protein [Bacillus aquiflavi]|uniref:LytTR family transcriptional regulator n=1 Tax=Bacillus aquiflavi TaxID=2672567 RepID=A0A6B3VX66_9BACI|nr:LytTR family DNA-binding domain-containing protein [Bacillus aquiflavi]MBA4535740.1 LytTR family transcriptional regulator DNA-binding domain-containing protein [Bacillus aquiflavi]NEY80116.1 LytTR family transcriptional regulator [Bacillus aquiflavi]UAC47992.1 LytTR family transcriptional regulator DNA-binding domain-containing protein [Bacillus aquiflavi]
MDQFTVSSIMQVIGEIVPKDTSIAVSDHKNYIYYQPSKKIDLKIKPGDQIKEGTATHKALTIRQKISEYIDREVFGVSYFGISFPIFESGIPKGAVTAILPTKPLNLLSSFITVRTEDRWVPISHSDIVFLEAENRKTKVQGTKATGTHKYNLSELEFFLPNQSFIRCHRSYIVNVNHIAEIQPDSHSTFLLVMNDRTKIPVSQTYASHFRKILGF